MCAVAYGEFATDYSDRYQNLRQPSLVSESKEKIQVNLTWKATLAWRIGGTKTHNLNPKEGRNHNS